MARKKFSELRAKLSPAAQARAAAITKDLLEEMALNELHKAPAFPIAKP